MNPSEVIIGGGGVRINELGGKYSKTDNREGDDFGEVIQCC